MTLPKIKHVRAWFIGGATAEQGAGGGDYHDQGANHWIDDHIATPMSKYKQYEQSRQSFGINVLGTLIVEVEADNGQTGFAVSTAGEMGCFIVEKHLNRFIEGKCVSDIKLIHDQMLNATLKKRDFKNLENFQKNRFRLKPCLFLVTFTVSMIMSALIFI